MESHREEEDDDEHSLTLTTTSSDDLLFHFEQNLSSSSSSDLNLSNAFLSSNQTDSTLSLTALENFDDAFVTSDDDENISTTEQRSSSDQESVLFTRLSKELNVIEATFDSDFERIGGTLF